LPVIDGWAAVFLQLLLNGMKRDSIILKPERRDLMLPKERSETGQSDIFRSRLDQIIDLTHPLAKLARIIDWGYLETAFGEVYADVPGRPPVPSENPFYGVFREYRRYQRSF
jgi:IS5 family transposase